MMKVLCPRKQGFKPNRMTRLTIILTRLVLLGLVLAAWECRPVTAWSIQPCCRRCRKTGTVLRVDPEKQRVYVEGLNIIKRHQRPQQVRGAQRAETVGGVIEKEGPIHISNVMIIDPKDKKPTRVGVTREDGQRQRVTRRSGTSLD